MQLLLIRHAQSTNNRLVADTGTETGRVEEPPITELGVGQARALAARIGTAPYPRIDALYCSLMLRAVQTGGILADALDVPLLGHPDIFECGGPYSGDWAHPTAVPGLARAELTAVTPRLVLPDAATDTGWWPGPVEDLPAIDARAARVLAWLQASHPEGCVAMVVHGCLIARLLRLALQAGCVDFAAENTSTTLIDFTPVVFDGEERTPTLRWFNRTDHLTLAQASR